MAEAEVVQVEQVVAQNGRFELRIDIPQGYHFTTVRCTGFDLELEKMNVKCVVPGFAVPRGAFCPTMCVASREWSET